MAEERVTEREEQLSLQPYIAVLVRRWPVLAAIVGASLLIAGAYVRTAQPIYEATSMVRVVAPPSLTLLPVLPQSKTPETIEVSTVAQLAVAYLTIKDALSRASEQARNNASPQVREQLRAIPAEEFSKSIVTKTQDPDIVRISVRHPSPDIAYLLANSVAEALVHRLDEEARAEARAERIYIQGQIQSLQKQMNSVDERLAHLRKKLKVVNLDEEAKDLAETIRQLRLDLQTQIALEEAARNAGTSLRSWAGREAPLLSVDVVTQDPVYEELKKRLAVLEVEKTSLLGRYQPNHPEVQKIEESIEATKKAMDSQRSRTGLARQLAPNPFYGSIREQLAQLQRQEREAQARKEALKRLLDETEQRLSALPEMQRSLQDLIRRQMVLEQTYTNLLNRLYDAQIREAAKRGSVIVADRAYKPTIPVAPRKSLIVVVAIALGLLIGTSSVFLMEAMSVSVDTPEEARQIIGAPVLAIVPFVKPSPTGTDILDFMTSRRAAAESIRNLRTNIRFLSARNPVRTILITSSVAREGKSFIATCLAIAYAQAGQQVVLIDGDMRQPAVDRYLGLDRSVGLSSVLVGELSLQEALQTTPLAPLKVLAAGPTPPNPAELLESSAMVNLLKSTELEGHTIIIDSPPLLLVADPNVLAPLVDGVLVVVHAGHTVREALLRSRDQLTLSGANLIGVVLNQVSPRTGRGYYYYRYYYYYYRY